MLLASLLLVKLLLRFEFLHLLVAEVGIIPAFFELFGLAPRLLDFFHHTCFLFLEDAYAVLSQLRLVSHDDLCMIRVQKGPSLSNLLLAKGGDVWYRKLALTVHAYRLGDEA